MAEYPQPKQAEKQAVKQAQAAQLTRSDAAAAIVARICSHPRSGADEAQRRCRCNPNATPGPRKDKDNRKPSGRRFRQLTAATNDASGREARTPRRKRTIRSERGDAWRGGKRDVLGGGDPNAVPRAIADDSKRPQRVVEELAMAKVTRAIYSDRQLQQIMDDFWFNHFNVFAGKGDDRCFLTSYERDVIQSHTLGKFQGLLTATAKSPAMLFYLDNFLSADPRAAERQRRSARCGSKRARGVSDSPRPPQPQQQKNNDRGLNENYGRELMELHTLGVDGGYTQKDVTEVARCFTGWSIDKPRENANFKFDERVHDPDPKIVLGKKIHAGGMSDGEEVIDLLAHHPSTAKFISTKLARRFVSDNPPPALVARMAQTFQSSDGDIRAVLKTMIYSPEFWSREAYRAKDQDAF